MLDVFQTLSQELNRLILGQQHLVERLQIALLADGHLLVEGAPGLAKTRAIKSLADLISASFQRIQFTPDLLPADITGSEIFRPEDGTFSFQPGPVFHQLILADEINRAPAKVQSALLEAMGERQISVGGNTLPLPDLFLVMATQNPIEQEGTYPLPEAQLDRFLMHVTVDYPDAHTENNILELARSELRPATTRTKINLDSDAIMQAREAIMAVHMSAQVQEYLVQLVMSTRTPTNYHPGLADTIDHGASPRATIALDRCARARAWLNNRDFVTPDDVQSLAHDCLRHRLIVSLSAQARGQNANSIIDSLLELVPVV
ncbi:MAG: MoxR family ATPase [Gammaproteobacteria bacterium]|nr:MoxR family ATPase [Gammaproteobacteria bacterium]